MEEREGNGAVPDGADSPVFKRKIKNRKRVIFDSDDEDEKKKEGGEEGGPDEEKGRDMEISEKVKRNGKDEQKAERETQNGGDRMENGNRQEETEVIKNDFAGTYNDFVSYKISVICMLHCMYILQVTVEDMVQH